MLSAKSEIYTVTQRLLMSSHDLGIECETLFITIVHNENCNFKGATLIGCQEPSVNEFRGSPKELHA